MANVIDLRKKLFVSHVKFKNIDVPEIYRSTEVKDYEEAIESLTAYLSEDLTNEPVEAIHIIETKEYHSTLN